MIRIQKRKRSDRLNNKSELKEGELELINNYTRRSLSEDEVYVFSLVLCDNEIDRDHERFSDEALKGLEKLFAGVTGIMDHDPKSKNQSARIFSCRLEAPEDRLTLDGRKYKRLTARAYIPVAQCSEELIAMIDSGIKKEVSIGCSVGKRICSVCGEDIGRCGHIKGRVYDGKHCYAVLDEPKDAYEWSFVAVPAQKAAGIIKGYKITGEAGENDRKGEITLENNDIEKRIFIGGKQSFTADEISALADRLRTLNEKAADGETYRRRLETDINKAAAIALPGLKRDTLCFITDKMSARQLEELCAALTEKAASVMPLRPQLSPAGRNEKHDNSDYRNI